MERSAGTMNGSSSADCAVHQVATNPPIQQSGSSIRIGYDLPEDAKRHVSISYEITVPATTAVQAHSGSGEVRVTESVPRSRPRLDPAKSGCAIWAAG